MSNLNSKCKGIIIDDDEDFCTLTKKWCDDLKIFDEIIISHNVNDAKQKLISDDFLFIFVDEHLEGKSGLNLIKNIKKEGEVNISAVLYCSTKMIKEYALIALRLGVITFLVKPTNKETFQERVMGIIKAAKKKSF